jgi:hypothetical protein
VNVAQHQALVLSGVSLTAFVFFVGLIPSSRRTWFGVFAAFDLLLAALLFGTVAVLDISGWRAEIVVTLLMELPVVFVISWVCLAQAGLLPARLGPLPVEPAARRPRLRAILMTAPLFLLLTWALAAVIGLAWPSPAQQAFAPAPPQFVIFKWTIMASEGFYSGLAALTFAMAARSTAPALRLRLKNLTFSVGMLCLALIALVSAAFAGVRLWISDESRRAVLEALLTLETYLAALCLFSFAFGLTLRYTPIVGGTLLRQIQTGWLLAQERFESLKWRAITAGRARGAIRASHHVAEAADLQGLSDSDTEKALTAIQLVAVMQNPATAAEQITPETARELYELQEEVLRDEALASKIGWATRWGPRTYEEVQTVKSAPLHDALEAALDLVDYHREQSSCRARPLWHHLVAVSAADAGLIDPARVRARLGHQPEHRVALDTYDAVKSSLRSRTLNDQEKISRDGRRA